MRIQQHTFCSRFLLTLLCGFVSAFLSIYAAIHELSMQSSLALIAGAIVYAISAIYCFSSMPSSSRQHLNQDLTQGLNDGSNSRASIRLSTTIASTDQPTPCNYNPLSTKSGSVI